MRRTFKGDRLYASVFSEYVHYLLTKGYPINFFPEGGRSRTGRLLSPKTGLYSMVMESQLRNKDRPVILVPISISYDKIVEGKTYEKELSGGPKESESILNLLENLKILKDSFGKVYVSVGAPLTLGDYLSEKLPEWRAMEEMKSNGLSKTINDVANEVMVRINKATGISPTSLLATIILACQNKAIPRDELSVAFHRFWGLLEKVDYGGTQSGEAVNFSQELEQASKLLELKNFKNIAGDIIYIEQKSAVRLSYYRNSILHQLAVPATIAQMFQSREVFSSLEIKQSLKAVYPWLKRELFLKWDLTEIDEVANLYLDNMVEFGLLVRINEHEIRKPHYLEQAYTDLTILAQMISSQLYLYGIGVELLSEMSNLGSVNRELLEVSLKTLIERTAIIQGDNLVNLIIKEYLPGVYSELKDQGILVLDEEGHWQVKSGLPQLRSSMTHFVPVQLRKSIHGLLKEWS